MTHDSDTFDWQNLANLIDVLSVSCIQDIQVFPLIALSQVFQKTGMFVVHDVWLWLQQLSTHADAAVAKKNGEINTSQHLACR